MHGKGWAGGGVMCSEGCVWQGEACVVGGGMHGKGACMAMGACVARGEGRVCRRDGH